MKKTCYIPILISTILLTSCSIFGNLNNSDHNGSQVIKDDLKIYGNDKEIGENDTIEVETYYDFFFTAKIKDDEATITNIVVEDDTVLLAHSKSIYPIKNGQTKVTITAKPTWTSKEYTRQFTIKSVCHDELDSIYVSNDESGITIDNANNVSFSGKVFAKFKNGVTRYINNDEKLTYSVDLANSNSTNKRVNLSYSINSQTVSCSYLVPVSNANPIEKTTLKHDFNTYYKYGYYSSRGNVNTSGVAKILAIPVWFTDSNKYFSDTLRDRNGKTQKEQVLIDLNEALFGTPIRKNDYSLKTYYEEESFGQLSVQGKVSEWFNSNWSSETDYHTNASDRDNILKDAYDWYQNIHPEDTTQYDCVMLFYGSTKYGPKDNNYTAFAAKMTTKYKNISSYMWISSLSIYGISHYRDDVKNLSDLSDNSPNDALNVATITHEFAHTMGAIDLYSNSSRETGGVTVYPFGEYSMQSADQAGHDAYHMMGFNWVNPYVLDASKDYGVDSLELTINDLHSSGDAIIVTPSWNNNDSPFDEYILVELFDTQSVNSYKVSNRITGVRVYHVDSRLFDLNGYDLTTDTQTNCVIPFTNTYGTAAGPTNSHPVLNNYKNYDLVHQIRKNKVDNKNEKIEYITTDHAKSDNWFVKGDSFSLEKYADQFLDKGALDSGLTSLGWTFEITSLNTNEHGATATIRFNKTL